LTFTVSETLALQSVFIIRRLPIWITLGIAGTALETFAMVKSMESWENPLD